MSDDMCWRKARASGNQGGNCVEVASRSDAVLIRDTKSRDAGHITVSASAWRVFVSQVTNNDR
jgi:hypothetical protein